MLLAAFGLTMVGGAVGLLISFGICAVFPKFGLTEYVGDPVVSPAVAALTATVLGLVGLMAGYFPAKDAANLDPVIAMKM